MRTSFRCLCTVVLLASAAPASAQLFESVGIRAQGLGGAFVAVADDATATWWNPAGLATGPFFDALVEYDRLRPSAQQQKTIGVAVTFPALGISYYHLPINQMRIPTSTGTTATDRQESRQEPGGLGVYGLTMGQSIGAHLVVASTLKLERAGEAESDLDLGAMARYGIVQLGVSVKNVRQAEFETADGVLALDRQARAGVALLGQSSGWINAITLAADADLTTTTTIVAGETRYVAGGLELWIFRRKVGLRAGASRNTVEAKGSSASGGVSVAVMSGASVKTYLDAQYTNGSDRTRRSWGIALRSSF